MGSLDITDTCPLWEEPFFNLASFSHSFSVACFEGISLRSQTELVCFEFKGSIIWCSVLKSCSLSGFWISKFSLAADRISVARVQCACRWILVSRLAEHCTGIIRCVVSWDGNKMLEMLGMFLGEEAELIEAVCYSSHFCHARLAG